MRLADVLCMDTPSVLSADWFEGNSKWDFPLESQYLVGMRHDKYLERCLNSCVGADHIFNDKGRFSGRMSKEQFFSSETLFFAEAIRSHPVDSIFFQGERLHDVRQFLGKKDQASTLHFDWNLCPNVLLVTEGMKQIDLWRPKESVKLKGYANISSNPEGHFPSYSLVIKKGEAAFIPPLWWHQITNITNTTAWSFRFSPQRPHDFIMRHFYPSWKWVQIMSDSCSFEKALKATTHFVEYEKDIQFFENVELIFNRLLKMNGPDHMHYRKWCLGYIEWGLRRQH